MMQRGLEVGREMRKLGNYNPPKQLKVAYNQMKFNSISWNLSYIHTILK